MTEPTIVMEARTQSIADLVDACARGELAFSGPDSLCAKIAAMGFKTTSLYEAVTAARDSCSVLVGGRQQRHVAR